MTQLDSSNYSESSLVLTGTKDIQIQILKGRRQIEEKLRRKLKENLTVPLWDEESILERFEGGTWAFHPNGQFCFTPSQIADCAQEYLDPIFGSYSKTDGVIELRGERQSSKDLTIFIDGFIYPNRSNFFVLDIAITDDSKIAKISQILSQESQAAAIEINGIQVPSIFSISLKGKTEAQPFGPLPGILKILPKRHPEDPNPFFVRLSTEVAEGVNGCFLWSSFQGFQMEQGERHGEIVVRDGQVRAEFIPAVAVRVGLTWDTVNRGKFKDLLPVIGVDVESGTLNFSIQGDRVSGQIDAKGIIYVFSGEPSRTSNYKAAFTGKKREERLAFFDRVVPSKYDKADKSAKLIDSFEKEEVPVSTVFKVSLQGKTEAQSFGPLSGTLTITASHLNLEDSNRHDVILVTDLKTVNGDISWSSFDEIHVQDDRICLEVKHPKLDGNSWFTLPHDISLAGMPILSDEPIPAQMKRGTFIFTIRGDRLFGEIHASGVLLFDPRKPSTYEARITGQKQVSDLAEEIRMTLNVSSFKGFWDTGKDVFGRIELQENGQRITGTYTGRGGGNIEGIVAGNRLDFTWEDSQQGKGWGFFRAVFSRDIMVGLWGDGTDKTKSQSLIATRKFPPLLTSQTLTELDAEKLKVLGENLISEGRCELATELLENVLIFYKQERKKALMFFTEEKKNESNQDSKIKEYELENVIREESNIIRNLIRCDLEIGDYPKLLKQHLNDALYIQTLLTPKKRANRLFKERTWGIKDILSQDAERLKSMENFFDSGDIGLVDISLEQNENTQELFISTTEEASPAHVAGILSQDIVVKIDGKSTQGMALDQANDSLKGSPGTQVTLTVRRGNQELDFQLVRARAWVSSAQRQLIEALKFCFHKLHSLRKTIRNDLTKLENIVVQEQEDPLQALLLVSEKIENLREQLDKEINTIIDTIIEQGKVIFRRNNNLYKDLDFLFYFSKVTNKLSSGSFDLGLIFSIIKLIPGSWARILASINSKNLLMEIEKEIAYREERFFEAVKSDKMLTPMEKKFFQGYFFLVMDLIMLSVELKVACVRITKIDVNQFEERQKQMRDEAARLADYIEKARRNLIRDSKKIDFLGEAQPFFQQLVSFLVKLGDLEEALLAVEKSQTRAFVDLLATRPDIQKGLKQISSREKLLLSTARAPAITFQDILEMIRQQ